MLTSDNPGDQTVPEMVKLSGKVEEGLIPSEKIVRVEDADGGFEEVPVSARSINEGRLLAAEVGSQGDRVLVELPRESASGKWRMWVKRSAVGA